MPVLLMRDGGSCCDGAGGGEARICARDRQQCAVVSPNLHQPEE